MGKFAEHHWGSSASAISFVPAGDIPAAEALVTGWGEAILLGNSRAVVAGIQRRAAADPPRPGSEHQKNIRKTIHYLQAKVNRPGFCRGSIGRTIGSWQAGLRTRRR